MDQLLDALEIKSAAARAIARVGIPVLFVVSMLCVAIAEALAEEQLPQSPFLPPVWVACVWSLWTVWHSILFPRGRRHILQQRRRPYRAAFMTHIYFGITIAIAQMIRPIFNGEVLSNYIAIFFIPPVGWNGWVTLLIGNTLCVGGGMLFVWAWQTIGVANAGFVPEFVRERSFVPLRVGPYGRIRHPLFWAGIYFSIGCAFLADTAASYMIAAVNLSYGLLYNKLEDRRLIEVFGNKYSSYASSVPAVIPVLRD